MIDIGEITDLTRFHPAPTNRYVATVTGPRKRTPLIPGLDTKTLAIRCESAELPGKSVPTSDSRLYGPIRKIPYNLAFIDSTFTFACSNDEMIEKRFFDKWVEYMIDNDTFDVEYYDSLVGQINLKVLNEQNSVLYEVDYIDAFPINVSAISLGYAQNGEYAKVSVTFSYRKWTRKVSTIESAGGFRDSSDFESEIILT